MRAQWVTVGRAEEHSIAEAHIAEGGVVLAGPPGVGKSRLAADLLDAADGRGAHTKRLAATASGAAVPLGALVPALPQLDPTGQGGFALLRAVVAELSSAPSGASGPVVLGIDDAHQLDDLSATAIHQLVTTHAAAVVVTVRSGEEVPDAVRALWKDGLLARIELQPLARHEVDELVAGMLGDLVAAPTLDLVWRHSEGNPLFARELVVSGIESGRLDRADGLWRWEGPFTVSTRLADLIEVRIGGLGDGERDALALLAFGEPLGIDVLEELGVAAAVAPLERRGIATVLGDGDDIEVRLTHPLYADVARGRTPVTEARTLQARLADVIARRGSTDALRLATWRVAAGLATDPAMLVTAADTANGMFEHETAERLGRLALAGGGRFDASIAVGEALIGQERFAEADALLAGVDLGELNDAEVVRVAECRHTALAGAAETDQAEAMLLDAHRHVSGPAWRDFLLAERAALLAVAGRLERALEAAPAVDDDALPPATRFRSLSALGIAWCMTGRPDLAVAAVEAAAPSVVALRDTLPRAPGWVASAWLLGLLHQGDLDGADRLMELVAEGLPGGFSDAWERLLTYRGVSCVLRGRPRTAARWLHESTVLHGPSDPGRRAALSGALLAQALALCGEVDEAAAWAERSRERQGHAEVWFAPTIDAAEAWVAAARNELTTSVELCERAAAAAAARGDVVMEAQALHDAVRFGAVRRPTARLGELASSCDGAWVRSFAAHAAALDAADGAALDEVSSSFASIGAALYAAEVAAEAATAHEQAGLRARASASSARSAALLAGCEGATTPILRAGSTRARLSRREREVALLAADGLSNKAIAERLSVSVRTVEGHLYQAFTKLGAATREELSDLL